MKAALAEKANIARMIERVTKMWERMVILCCRVSAALVGSQTDARLTMVM